MRFNELKIGQRFKYEGQFYTKIHPIMETCCTVKYNAARKDKKFFKFEDDTEVKKVKK